ncbi:MAG: ABC transporter permease [Actinobacteria bacterium]|nr:ABC transporter permease [Actinomycetota bacterium]
MRLLAAELLKLRTTRVTYVLIGVAVLMSGLAAAAIVGSGSLGDDGWLELAQGAGFSTTLATIVGILLVTNEYRHGTITTTFLAEPRRVRVLVAKLAAALLAGVALAFASIVTTALVALPWAAARGDALPLDGHALEAVGRMLLGFALSAALGAAVGAIIQNQVGSIIVVFVWFLIVESIVGVLAALVFGDLGEPDPVSPYLPGSALGGIIGGEGSEFMLRGGPAALLALGYVAALAVLAAFSMTRRDP